jgi:hypothetical protein
MILTEDKHFADAVKNGLKIKKQTIYYTGKLEETTTEDFKPFKYYAGKGIYVGKLADIKGENHKHIFVALNDLPEQLTWEQATNFKYNDGYKLPDIRELSFIHLYKDAVNSALKKHDGKPFKDDDWYWSATECNATDAWYLNFSSGYRDAGNKYNSWDYVRPVLAF